ncbi:TIR domain-containing protein [Flavobacterium artemisiae]|uniref:TIR domain-containing protein n=1 Tax=Flavobacterium artemisiae TaxID=2126556 RepID=A0ABW4HCX5_9FLAO
MSKKKIFVSHKGINDESFQKLKEIISKEFDIDDDNIDGIKDEQTKEEEEEIVGLLKIRINEAEKFICLIDENTFEDAWVNSEIEYAHICGKRIVGIYALGSSDSVEIPATYKKYGGPILSLNSLDKLNEILSGENIPNVTPDGNPSPPLHEYPPRVKC